MARDKELEELKSQLMECETKLSEAGQQRADGEPPAVGAAEVGLDPATILLIVRGIRLLLDRIKKWTGN